MKYLANRVCKHHISTNAKYVMFTIRFQAIKSNKFLGNGRRVYSRQQKIIVGIEFKNVHYFYNLFNRYI